MSYVYFIGDGEGPVKIGTSRNPQKRLAQMQTGNPAELRIEALIQAESVDGYLIERAIHAALNRHRLRGEWFARAGAQPVIDSLNDLQRTTLLPDHAQMMRAIHDAARGTA